MLDRREVLVVVSPDEVEAFLEANGFTEDTTVRLADSHSIVPYLYSLEELKDRAVIVEKTFPAFTRTGEMILFSMMINGRELNLTIIWANSYIPEWVSQRQNTHFKIMKYTGGQN